MDRLTAIFKALADETRLRIVILLAGGELCVCQLSGILKISQPTVSKHLAKLRDMHLVAARREEKYIFYRLDNATLRRIAADILANIEQYPRLTADQSRLADKDKILSHCKESPALRG